MSSVEFRCIPVWRVTTDGLPLGLAAMKFWTRSKFKGCNALKKKINPMRVPIEKKESIRWLQNLKQSTALLNAPQRCVHIGDRESDIYELFCTAEATRDTFPGANLRRSPGRGWKTHDRGRDARSACQRAEARPGQRRKACSEPPVWIILVNIPTMSARSFL